MLLYHIRHFEYVPLFICTFPRRVLCTGILRFFVHAIQTSEKVNFIFEHAIGVFSRKDDANHTRALSSGWQL
uniref:Uncharacterized protein n=1 Tax=Helianthus annuus TaxID=4232 RepID=A0A251TV47_HELAN